MVFKNHITSLLLLAMTTWLSACRVSRDIATPVPELPAAFRGAAGSADSGIATLSRAEFFPEAELQQLITRTLERNYDMQIAAKNIEQSRLVLKQTKWGYAPALSLQLQGGTTRPSGNSLNGISLAQFLGTTHIEDYSAAVNLSWEADIWGKVRNQKRAALARYLQSEEARKALQTQLVAGVSQGYYNLLMLDAQLDVARKNLALSDSTLQIFGLQYNAGQVTALGIRQAEAQRLTAAQLVPQIEQEMAIQENALSILAGELPNRTDRTRRLAELALAPTLPTGLPAEILSRRPDVKASELELLHANAQVGLAKANLYPALRITAAGGVNAFKFSNWFSVPASLFGSVLGGVAQPLLQRRELRTQYRLSEIEREKTVIRFRQTVLNAVGEVSDALAQTEQLRSRYRISSQKVLALQDAIANANLLFRNGMATYLEVITAQSNLLQSELELSDIKRAQLSASVSLYRALGGGWD